LWSPSTGDPCFPLFLAQLLLSGKFSNLQWFCFWKRYVGIGHPVSWELLIFCCSCCLVILIICVKNTGHAVKRKRQEDEAEYQYQKRLIANTQDNNEDDIAENYLIFYWFKHYSLFHYISIGITYLQVFNNNVNYSNVHTQLLLSGKFSNWNFFYASIVNNTGIPVLWSPSTEDPPY
jgi:hypothetical protein